MPSEVNALGPRDSKPPIRSFSCSVLGFESVALARRLFALVFISSQSRTRVPVTRFSIAG